MSFIQLDLTGPGPLDRCEDVVDTMRRDGRVLSVYPEPEEDQHRVGSRGAQRARRRMTARVSASHLYGFGALYWAALHPAQAWRIVMPVESARLTEEIFQLQLVCVLTRKSSGEARRSASFAHRRQHRSPGANEGDSDMKSFR